MKNKISLKVKTLILVIMSGIAGCLYRMGGSDRYDTKWRDLGVSSIATVVILILGIKAPWWAYLLHFGLLFGALTTYNKWFGRMFFGRKDKSVYVEDWWITGLFYALAGLPLVIVSGQWLGFALRCIVCSVGVMIWSEWISNAVKEELGRGFICIISTPLLLI